MYYFKKKSSVYLRLLLYFIVFVFGGVCVYNVCKQKAMGLFVWVNVNKEVIFARTVSF